VVVCGAGGLLGSALVPHLRSTGADVQVSPGRSEVDLAQWEAAKGFLDAARPQVVVNLAALTDVDYCEQHPAEAYRVNAGMVLNLARWIESQSSHTQLIQISSDQVYDGEGPHDESHVVPLNYYAWSKCLAEQYASRVNGTSLRTNFFGRSRLPQRPSFSDWLVSSLRAAKPVTVFEDVLFSPLSLESLVSRIALVISRPLPGIFNLGSRGGLSKADFAFRLARAAGLATDSLTRGAGASMKRPARRPLDMRMSSQRFEAAFQVACPPLTDEIDTVGREYGR
jgi:dTDP-4-dehydrorhamnose reductase